MNTTVTGPVIIRLEPDELNVVLKGLEELPLKFSRKAFNSIETQVMGQLNPPPAPGTSEKVVDGPKPDSQPTNG